MKPIRRAISFIIAALTISAIAFATALSMLPLSAKAQGLVLCGGSGCTMQGLVTFVGTMTEHHTEADGYHAMFRVRVQGPCSREAGKGAWRELILEIRSGRMDGVYAHNNANLINAYSTLLTALTTKKKIQIDGLKHCEPRAPAVPPPQNLWTLQIGIYGG